MLFFFLLSIVNPFFLLYIFFLFFFFFILIFLSSVFKKSIYFFLPIFFLVACTQLYKPLCWSVSPLVRRLVGRSLFTTHATYGDWPCAVCFWAATPNRDKDLSNGEKFCLFVHLSNPLWLALRHRWLALRPLQLALRPFQLAIRSL